MLQSQEPTKGSVTGEPLEPPPLPLPLLLQATAPMIAPGQRFAESKRYA